MEVVADVEDVAGASFADEASTTSASATGVSSGEMEAGSMVSSWLGTRMKSFIVPDLVSGAVSGPPNRGVDRVRGLGWHEAMGEEPRRNLLSSSINIMFCFRWSLRSFSSSVLRFSKASTSCRLRSRDDCAARRFRRTRSTLRCSFSSSVLARFLVRGLVTNDYE